MRRLNSIFTCPLRRRLLLGKKFAEQRTSPPPPKRTLPASASASERSRLWASSRSSQQVLLRRRARKNITKHLLLAKRPRFIPKESLETEEMCSKRRRKDDSANITGFSITRVSRDLRKEYHMTIDDDFFDAPPVVEATYGSLQAFDFTEDPEEEQQIYSGVKDALGTYNQSWGTDYELVDILMTNSAVVRGMMYYITFTGISARRQRLKTFQAKLWLDYTYRMHFLYCGKKKFKLRRRGSTC